MKNLHFGVGLERSRSNGTARFSVLVLIASLAAFLLWLLGTAADQCGLEQHMRPGSRKRRAYSRVFWPDCYWCSTVTTMSSTR